MTSASRSLAIVAVLASAVPAGAQPISLGPELFVNTYYTGAQRRPAVAAAEDGSFVVVWDSFGQDSDVEGIFAQRFDAAGGPAGTEIAVNTYVPLQQASPAVASTGDGAFVVVWESMGEDGNSYGVFGQRFDGAGAPAGTEFQVNTYFTGAQRSPTVAVFDDGGFVVVWQSYGQDGDGYGVFAQRFAATGEAVGEELAVNAATAQGQQRPRVATDAGGGFVVVWGSNDGRDGDGSGVFGQRFDGTGSPVGTEFQANGYTTGGQRFPDVTMTAGGFVVVWQSYGADSSGDGIAARRYDALGAPMGDEFVVNTYAYDNQNYPRLAADTLGGFVVVWESQGLDGEAEAIVAQQFDAAGATTGPEFLVNTTAAGEQRRPAVAGSAAGSFVVAWEGAGQAGNGYDVFAQAHLDATPVCGDVIPDGEALAYGSGPHDYAINATDALALLQASVAILPCLPCVCDVDSSGSIAATDALIVLRRAVGHAVVLMCPAAC